MPELTCPNPECRFPNVRKMMWTSDGTTYFYCITCNTQGPYAKTEAEAIRLWKMLGSGLLGERLTDLTEAEAALTAFGSLRYREGMALAFMTAVPDRHASAGPSVGELAAAEAAVLAAFEKAYMEGKT
jgi:hypothetical protein